MAARKITLTIMARNLLRRTFRDIKADLASLRSFAGGVGRFMRRGFIFAAAGLATLTAGFVYALRLVRQQEQADVKLAQAVQKQGAALGYTEGQLRDYANELQKTTSFGDEATQSVIAMVAATGKVTGANLKRATEAILDVTSALDRKDWHRIGLSMSKALQDPTRASEALSAAGIDLTETEDLILKRMARTNQVAAAQDIILKKVENTYGGLARAQRKTISGAWEGLQNRLGDVVQNAAMAFARGMNFEAVLAGAEARLETIANRAGALFEPIGKRVGEALGKMFSADVKVREQGMAMFGDMIRDGLALARPHIIEAGLFMGEAFVSTVKSAFPRFSAGVAATGAAAQTAGRMFVEQSMQPFWKRYLKGLVPGVAQYEAVRGIQQTAAAAGTAYAGSLMPGASASAPVYVQEVQPIDGVKTR